LAGCRQVNKTEQERTTSSREYRCIASKTDFMVSIDCEIKIPVFIFFSLQIRVFSLTTEDGFIPGG
jgi:hypothetical protein